MNFTSPSSGLRARKQVREDIPDPAATSGNGSSRPPLRLVTDATQVTEPVQRQPRETAPVGGHADDIGDALASHAVTSTHPPTLVDAAMKLWPSRDEVRHGLAGQLAAAAAGLAQLAVLSACWGIAHVFGASKTRAAILTLALILAGTVWAVASHT